MRQRVPPPKKIKIENSEKCHLYGAVEVSGKVNNNKKLEMHKLESRTN